MNLFSKQVVSIHFKMVLKKKGHSQCHIVKLVSFHPTHVNDNVSFAIDQEAVVTSVYIVETSQKNVFMFDHSDTLTIFTYQIEVFSSRLFVTDNR